MSTSLRDILKKDDKLPKEPRKRREPPTVDKNNPPKTLSPEEAMVYVGVTQATWYRHIHPAIVKGEILSLPIGRQRRIITTSLDAWLTSQAREGWR